VAAALVVASIGWLAAFWLRHPLLARQLITHLLPQRADV
jgi:hypothetical protein